MDPGHYFPWHFDGNEFTLSILIQKAEKGGVFEYVQDLRSPEDENFEEDTNENFEETDFDQEFNIDLYISDDEIPEYKIYANNFSVILVTVKSNAFAMN